MNKLQVVIHSTTNNYLTTFKLKTQEDARSSRTQQTFGGHRRN